MKLCTKCGENPALDNETHTCQECENRALDALIVAAARGIDPFKELGLDTGEPVPVMVGNTKRYGGMIEPGYSSGDWNTPTDALRECLHGLCQHCKAEEATQDATFDFTNADPPLKEGPVCRTYSLCQSCTELAYALIMMSEVTAEEFCNTLGKPAVIECGGPFTPVTEPERYMAAFIASVAVIVAIAACFIAYVWWRG